MSGTTPLGIPYPTLGPPADAPNGPLQVQAAAEAIDALLQQRGVIAARRVYEPDGPITVADSTWHPIAAYGDPVNFESDPLNLITFALGVFTLALPGLWGVKAMLHWPAVGGSTGQHSRSLRILRNGSVPTDDDGEANQPYPAGAWGAWKQSYSGTVVTTGSATTVQLEAYQTTGGSLDAIEASFAVWLIAAS